MGASRTHTIRFPLELLEHRRLLSFNPAVDYPAGASPAAVATADFNRDGRPDIAVANADNVSVHLGNPNGTFQPAQHHAGGAWPQNMAVADFNADGKMDIVTGHNQWAAGGVSLLLGNGDGMFQPARIIYGYLGFVSVAVGDFNSDGKIDVMTSGLDTVEGAYAQLSLFVGHGDGTFTPQYPIDIRVGSAIAITAGDFNADGKLDVAGNAYEGAVILFGNGAGDFAARASQQSALQQSAAPVWSYGLSVAVGDLNADGKHDLVFGDQATNQNGLVTVYHSGGDGSLLYSQRIEVGPNPASLAIVDVNRDGRMDLVTANRGIHNPDTGISVGGSVSVLLGKTDGTLQAAQEFMPDTQTYSVATADFNADVFPDLALLRRSSLGNVSVLLNDGNWSGKTWIGPTSGGNWSTAANWSPGGVPTAGDVVTISGKSVNLSASATVAGLNLTGGAMLILGASGGRVLRTSTLAITGADSKLNLNDNDLIIDYSGVSPVGIWTGSDYDGVSGMIRSGRITSSLASGNLKTLGVAEAREALGISGTQTATFAGQAVDSTSVLVKFTWGGDATLDGKINIDDYGRIDGNVGQSGSVFGWFNGDFNYDGKINIDDYGIIDGNISQQDDVL